MKPFFKINWSKSRKIVKSIYFFFFGWLIDKYNRIYEKNLRTRLKCHDFSIICSNCMGGCIYHRLGERFNTPTINLFIRNKDFVRFATNLEYYLSLDLDFIQTEYEYPVARIDDVTIYFNHYKDKSEAETKWNERKKRVDYNNLYILLVGEEGLADEDFIKFSDIKCRNKLIIVDKKNKELSYTLNIKPHKYRKDGMRYMDRRFPYGWAFEKRFDYVKWINDGRTIEEQS